MKILIVSDTHGRNGNLEEAVMRETPIDYLIHCGDVEGQEYYIEALAECPCYIVSGNNDFFSDLPREEEIYLGGKRIFVTHGHYLGVSLDSGRLLEEAAYRGCDVAVFGHIHRPVMEKHGEILLLNPGSLSHPRQRGRQPSYMIWEQEGLEEPRIKIKYL